MNNSFRENTILKNTTILECLRIIDKTKKNFLIVLDKTGVLIGIITEGEIRRLILKGLSLADNIIYNNKFICINQEDSFLKLFEYFKIDKINFIPIVDNSGKLVNVITKKQFHVMLLKDIEYDLKAASHGLEWLKGTVRNVEDYNELADIYLSAGFDLFFDEKLMGKFKKAGVFKSGVKYDKFNSDFENDYMSLKDPSGDYSILAVVPAVFLVNTQELNGREIPKTWADLLKPEFEKSVSLPVSDFDLFNAILLNIYKLYGDEGVKKLGKSLIQSLHPEQMVKYDRLTVNRPTVTIMPYFFTRMTKEGGTMIPVWPEDGAIISPVFMLTKAEKLKEMESLIDFLSSKAVGEILSHKGFFPSVNPEVENLTPRDKKYLWIGWDYIYNNNLQEQMHHCEDLFNKAGLE